MISVLYVDDESDLLDVGKGYLEQSPEFSVTTAPSPSVALERIKSNGIQAIVSDYEMPGMDGIEFLKQVRATNKNIPFIIFTGKGREEIAIEAFENGADFYLQKGGAPKPQFAELMLKIKTAVEHRRADAQVTALNRLYTVLSATNKAIVRIHDKKELLNEICRIVVNEGGFRMAWAGLVNSEKHLIEPVAASGHVEGYLNTISISTDDTPRGRGPTGTAFRERTFNVCNDIERDPKMGPWRTEALALGYRSVAAFPFAPGTQNAGVITYYASEPGFFTDQIIRLLNEQSMDISFALVTFDHIGQRIAAEDELKQSELRYRRLFETAQDGILILDGDTGAIIDANPFILDLLGYALDDFVGRHLWELGFLKDKTFAKTAFEKLKTEGYIRYENLPLETKQGKAMSVEFVSNVYLVGDKRIIQCNIRDITDRKVTQAIVDASETRYRRLFETTQDGILILDGESGEIIDANPFILNLLGYPMDDFIGKHLWELGFLKDKTFANTAFEKLKTEGYIRYENLPLETKQGKAMSVEFVSNVYLVGDKRIIQCNIRDITERKVTQGIVHASETRYRRLFETAQDGILILDGESGEIIDANPFILNLLGYPMDDFIGKHLWELGFFKDTTFANTAFEKLKTVENIRYEDLPLETKQGKSISVDFISNVYLVGDKRIIQCNIRDITDRKVAEVERARLAAIVEYTDDAIIGKSLEGLITTWNAGAEHIYGYSAHEMVGKSISFLAPPNLPDESPKIIERIRNGEPVIRYETLHRTKDGGLINILLTASRIRDAQNRLIGVSTIAHDITSHKLVEEAMHASETRYRRLFETAQDGILILDWDTEEIIDANPFILDLLGYPMDDFVGKHLWELGFLKDKTFAKTAFEKLKTEGYIRYEDLPLETKQGKATNVEFICNVYTVGDKRIIQCDIRDITDRKHAEDALALSSRKLNLMSGITRHDIINQLMVLSGSLDLAMGKVKEPERIAHINRAYKAAATIQQQIAFTKEYEELGVRAPTWQRLSEVICSAESPIAAKAISLEVPDDTLELYADPLLQKVFYNLFDNTRHHGGTVTQISISHHPAGTGLIITVADNGIGISPDDKKHLFERGFGKNTGLGLFLSKEILSITGISISETGTMGDGARFEILVPEGDFRFTDEPVPK